MHKTHLDSSNEKFLDPSPMKNIVGKFISSIVLYLFLSFLPLFLAIPSILIIIVVVVVVVVVDVVIVIEWFSCY